MGTQETWDGWGLKLLTMLIVVIVIVLAKAAWSGLWGSIEKLDWKKGKP